MKTITVIAKGPSAANAYEFIRRVDRTDIATINDAATLIPGVEIDYTFFTHTGFLPKIQPHASRIKSYVCPDLKRHEGTDPPDWIARRLIQYADRKCAGSTEDLQQRILDGGICHHNTTNGALHWLAKCGTYELIRVIGVDGGRQYAAGVKVLSDKWHEVIAEAEKTEEYLDVWRGVTLRLASVLHAVYGTEVEFYGD